MLATPAECILKDFVEFGDTGCADHEQSPPHQRTHAAEHYAKLIDRNGRYRRFRHANSLSKRKPTVLNLMTPRNLPLSNKAGCKGIFTDKRAVRPPKDPVLLMRYPYTLRRDFRVTL